MPQIAVEHWRCNTVLYRVSLVRTSSCEKWTIRFDKPLKHQCMSVFDDKGCGLETFAPLKACNSGSVFHLMY